MEGEQQGRVVGQKSETGKCNKFFCNWLSRAVYQVTIEEISVRSGFY